MNKIYFHIWAICCLCFLAASCQKDSASESPNHIGEGGSMARFTIVNNYLYSLDNTTLHIYNISQANQPVWAANVDIGRGIETIFSYNNYLFIGSTDGMYIYDISNPTNPANGISFEHATSCDPVVANDSLAFITLRGGGDCNSFVESGLYIVDITNINNPQEIYYQYMYSPYGLGYDNQLLFVCEGSHGLSVFDYTDPQNLIEVEHITDINTRDVIPQDGNLLVVGPEALYQYSYANPDSIYQISTLQYDL